VTRYSSAAPVDPPEPEDPVTVPELYPGQMVLPLTGLAADKAGATGATPRFQVHSVLQTDGLHPGADPPVRLAWTMIDPVAPVVVTAEPLV
jgi:hypothetical protein